VAQTAPVVLWMSASPTELEQRRSNMASRIAIFYLPILKSVAASNKEVGSKTIREQTASILGDALTKAERRRLLNKSPTKKGNYFDWALANLTLYKFLSKGSGYRLPKRGVALFKYLQKNPSLQLNRSDLARFPF
jgi:hypothetical protein